MTFAIPLFIGVCKYGNVKFCNFLQGQNVKIYKNFVKNDYGLRACFS